MYLYMYKTHWRNTDMRSQTCCRVNLQSSRRRKGSVYVCMYLRVYLYIHETHWGNTHVRIESRILCQVSPQRGGRRMRSRRTRTMQFERNSVTHAYET